MFWDVKKTCICNIYIYRHIPREFSTTHWIHFFDLPIPKQLFFAFLLSWLPSQTSMASIAESGLIFNFHMGPHLNSNRFIGLHSGKLTWNPKMEVWKMIVLFKQVIFRFQGVIFQGVSSRDSSSMKRWCMFSSNCGKGLLDFGGIKVKGLADCSKSTSHMMVKRMQEWKEKHNAYHISSLIHILFGYLQKYAPKILSYPENVSLVLVKTSPENPVLPDAQKNEKAPRKIIHFCKWQETLSHWVIPLVSWHRRYAATCAAGCVWHLP